MAEIHGEGDRFPFPTQIPEPEPHQRLVDSPSPPSSPSPSTPPDHRPNPTHRSSTRRRRYRDDIIHDIDIDPNNPFSPTSHQFISRDQPQHHSKPSATSKSIRALLHLTTEQLTSETTRANTAERNLTEAIARLRTTIETHNRTLTDHARISEELRLYKIEYEASQREVKRAQQIIDQLEEQKNVALENSMRDRSKVRKLVEERAVWVAREEGWGQGYKEGLERGRMMAIEAVRVARREEEYQRRINQEDEEEQENDLARDRGIRGEGETIRVRKPIPPSSISHRSEPRSVPDVAPLASALPVPTVTTPRPFSPAASSNHTQAPIPVPAPRQGPENIRPITVRNVPPSPSHRSIDIPPDGYIPAMDGNAFIGLPPPHELSIPVPSPTSRTAEESLPFRNDGGSTSEPRRIQTKDYAYSNGAPIAPTTRSPSALSRGSTRISQYDILSAPRDGSQHSSLHRMPGSHLVRDRSTTPTAGPRGVERSPTERIVDEWRSANPDVVGLGTPAPVTNSNDRQSSPRVSGGPRRASVTTRNMNANAREVAGGVNQRPDDATRPRSPLDWIFRRRFRAHTQSSPEVPDIQIEPPSQSPSNHSVPTVDTHPQFLGPEDAERPFSLPTEMSYDLAPVERSLPPIPASPSPILSGQLPPGFIPTSVTPSIPALPPVRSATSPRPQYDMAPIPPDVLYPEPPLRPATASSLQKSISTPKSSRRRRRDSLGSAMSPAPLNRPISIFSDQ